MEKIKRFFKEEDGTQVVETALVLVLIAVVCIIAITAVGNQANAVYQAVSTALTAAS